MSLPATPSEHLRSPPPTANHTFSHNYQQGHPDKDVSINRPTKRPRPSRLPNMAAARASPSSDSSSQSGMADNETEADPSQLSEHSALHTSAPPKKKRTRTLTTPHQSAVLHALLAKSRFPTTAMREEVGRQIGLSARKVQNQRQKARRPLGESAPLTRPPQFGPFPIVTTAGPSSSSYPSPPTGGHASEVSHSGPGSARSAGSLDSSRPLSGPGMPGWSSSPHQRRHSSPEERDPPRRVPMSPGTPLGNSQSPFPPRSPDGISTRDSRGCTRGLAPHPAAQATHIETSPHFSRVLPPINFGALEPRSSAEPSVSASSPFPPQLPSRTFVNTAQRHDASARSANELGSSPVSLSIPPPFALQPQPQWDPQTFVPFTRPEFASWSHPSGSARSSFSAVGAHDRVLSPRGRHFYTSSEPRRSGQLDPPLPHHIISPSRGQRHSTPVPSFRTSASGQTHARSENDVQEA
ncbi:hypothetical protein JVT61DRAFT_7530 [Boletus reticuloceps]|uniref:Homeobox domain-containing protein n=1 Tax=Boletus reticuloceps TaxID=495285 RepID=A0A8I2YJH6_9AGAM|nr:hypothetical protein JVT61DRAFT_7530 [Boletus reticuloceps]